MHAKSTILLLSVALLVLTGFIRPVEAKPKAAACQKSQPPRKESPAYFPKFDEFGDLNINDLKKRLDYFAVELKSVPNECGYIIEFRRRQRSEKVLARAKKAKKYLVTSKGIDAERVIIPDGGYADQFRIELRLGPVCSR
jgi:hypothetical protein